MDELGISAHRIDLSAKFLKLIIPLCQSGELCGSDKREISGVEEENGPFFLLFLVGKAHLAEVALGWLIRLHLKVRYFLPYLDTETAEVFHDTSSSLLGVEIYFL